MSQAVRFADVVDAADQLSIDEQEALVDILRQRLADEGRKRILADVKQARAEFAAGLCVEALPEDIVREAMS